MLILQYSSITAESAYYSLQWYKIKLYCLFNVEVVKHLALA